MRIEIGQTRPESFTTDWEGQYDVFSHFEYACGIPSVLYAVSTYKENGLPNLSPNAWSAFSGDAGGFYAVLPSLARGAHAFADIQRSGVFCVNFLSPAYYDRLMETIRHNGLATDEFAAGGFHVEPALDIAAPRVAESFLTLECRLHSMSDLSGRGATALVVGEVVRAAMDESYAQGLDGKYGEDGFALFLHGPKNLLTGKENVCAVASCRILRKER